ncbi:lipopolysaccharide biosynthesis protein [Spirosoma sp. KCTC 42546]|uniref:GNVR domain-containing protein n=1 Tax=Spirosoma sp. KCTC 42546 TaxID=2520506 RepID=UPI0011573202|nr:GNVR domain-containing protein [Spirosoma sp. KCTC 42546]QDK83098.1 lipopolysaccharide biosynthesis protein [Spirosoma sp. KCTC 42546]
MSVTKIPKISKIGEDEIEIRLSDIVRFLKDSRKTVFFWSIVFLIVGVLYAISQQNEYTASVKVMPELKAATGAGGGLSDLRSLAGLAGVNLGNMSGASEAIRPDLYPDILQSLPFSLYLLSQPVKTSESSKSQVLQTYFSQQSEKGISAFIGRIFSSNDKNELEALVPSTSTTTLQLTREQEALSKTINARVVAEMDKRSGIITITSRMPDAVVAATVARLTLDYLTNYVTNYRTGKARKQVEFLMQQVNNARQRYESAELQLASYRDRNRNVYANTAKIEEQRLQADYMLTQSVYSELSKQLEQARIKIEEESPVFQVLEPARVPLRKSGPQRTVITIGFTIFGTIVGLAVFFIRRFMKRQSN